MNNRKILGVFTCANLLLGFLSYSLFLDESPMPLSSTIAIGITTISLYYLSYILYKKRDQRTE